MKAYMEAGAQAVKELIAEWRPKKSKIGMMSILHLHGRAGNYNPHLVVSEGGLDKEKQWRDVKYFDTKKLRKKWHYHVLTALRKAIKMTKYAEEWWDKQGVMFDKYPTDFDCDCMPEKGLAERLVMYLFKYESSPPISLRRIERYDGQNVTYWHKDHRRGLVKETISAVDAGTRKQPALNPSQARPGRRADPGFAGRRRAVAALCRAAKAEGSAEARNEREGTQAVKVKLRSNIFCGKKLTLVKHEYRF